MCGTRASAGLCSEDRQELPVLLFHKFAVVDFVFDVKRLSLSAGFPVLLCDDAVGLREAFGRQRMGAKIAGQALDRELRQLFVRTLRVDDVLVAEFREALEEIHGAIGRIAGLHGEKHSLSIGFELLVFVIARLPKIQGKLNQRADNAEIEPFQLRFYLNALDAMIVVNMLDFVGQHTCEFVFSAH